MELGHRIQAARSAAKLSKAELARRVGVSHTAVAYWEEGETKSIKSDHLFAIAKATGCDPQWLQNGTGHPPGKAVNEGPAAYNLDTALGKKWAKLTDKEKAMALAILDGIEAAREQ